MKISAITDTLANANDVVSARGWCVIPVGARTRDDAVAILDKLATVCGPVIPHTAESLFADVTTADDFNDRSVPRPQSENGALFPHTDGVLSSELPAVMAMVNIRSATSGGESILVDARPIIRKHRWDGALDPLLDDDAVALRRGNVSKSVSVLRRRGRFIDLGFSDHEYNTAVPKVSCAAAFELLRRYVVDPAHQQSVQLADGDMILVANRYCLHGRTDFRDAAGHRRHLVRGWYGGPVTAASAFDGYTPD